MENVSNNKRIAKNTIFLYVRMLFSLVVSLYTSRVVLNALGATDYGINNVVGGVVTMFAFLSSTMATATQRFLSFELGKNDKERLRTTFAVSTTILSILAIIILLFVETIGIWLLNNKLVIPPDRIVAAHYVFQFVAVSLFVQILSVPYNAAIIAHEKMSAFAYIGIIEVMLRFGIAVLIAHTNNVDRLILYSALLCVVSILIIFLYIIYCKRNFDECSGMKLCYDKTIGNTLLSFFGWNTIGAFAYVAKEQGVNIVINMFCGTIVNAARGINSQVMGAIYGFISNFQVAINPQITKYYSSGEITKMNKLIFQGTKFSFLLFLFLSLPIFIDIDYILKIWLVNVPEYTGNFIRLTIILMSIETISYPIITALLAVGRVKIYQIVVGLLLLLNLPFSYFFLKFGYTPEVTLVVAIVLSVISFSVRLKLIYCYVSFPVKDFILNVLVRVAIVTVLSSIIPVVLYYSLNISEILKLIIICLSSWVMCGCFSYCIGCDEEEKNAIKNSIKLFFQKIHRR